MSQNSEIQVNLPKSGVVLRLTGKCYSVYKILRSYRNEKGQLRTDRVLIDKFDPVTEKLIPNAAYFEYYGKLGIINTLSHENSIRLIGTSFLINHIMDKLGLTTILNDCLETWRSDLLKTAVLYMVSKGNVFDDVLNFCQSNTLSWFPLSFKIATDLFTSITSYERMSFFKSWVALQHPDSFLAYDVASFSTYAKGLGDSYSLYTKGGSRLPQINLGCFLSKSSKLPMFYLTYPAPILDKSHLPYIMAYNEELGISNVVLVLDKDFSSPANLKHMDVFGLDFILAVKPHHDIARKAADISGANIHSHQSYIGNRKYAITSSGKFYGINSSIHVYLDTELESRQRLDIIDTVELMKLKLTQLKHLTKREAKHYQQFFLIDRKNDGTLSFEYNHEKIDAMVEQCVYFCLLSNTSLENSEVLEIYSQKDLLESSFCEIKNFYEGKRLYIQRNELSDFIDISEGKLFCAFIRLIVISEMRNKLHEIMQKYDWNMYNVITELDKIRVILLDNGERLMSPLTK
ncbi:MAG: transposase, partial [Deltaproteobacteria bacterium]|nr:transposase [Deltaproteobacteria bacterium]